MDRKERFSAFSKVLTRFSASTDFDKRLLLGIFKPTVPDDNLKEKVLQDIDSFSEDNSSNQLVLDRSRASEP